MRGYGIYTTDGKEGCLCVCNNVMHCAGCFTENGAMPVGYCTLRELTILHSTDATERSQKTVKQQALCIGAMPEGSAQRLLARAGFEWQLLQFPQSYR